MTSDSTFEIDKTMPASISEKDFKSTAADELDDGLDYEVSSSHDEAETVAFGDDDDEEDSDSGVKIKHDSSKDNGKKRKSKNDNLQNKKKMKMEYDSQAKKNLSLQDPELIAEKMATKVAHQNKDLSPLELGELYIGKSFIKSTADFTDERSLENLSKFVKGNFDEYLTVVEKPKKKKKTPKKQDKVAKELAKKQETLEKSKQFVTIISMSAIRACDVFRSTKELGSIKLIKKNKLKDDLEILDKSSARILATTPNRILRILSEPDSPIDEKNIKIIILDSSYLDLKQQNVLDLKEAFDFLRRICDNNNDVNIYLY